MTPHAPAPSVPTAHETSTHGGGDGSRALPWPPCLPHSFLQCRAKGGTPREPHLTFSWYSLWSHWAASFSSAGISPRGNLLFHRERRETG